MKPYGHLGKVGCYCCHGSEILPSRFQLGAQPHGHGGGKRGKSRRPAKRRARREARREVGNYLNFEVYQ